MSDDHAAARASRADDAAPADRPPESAGDAYLEAYPGAALIVDSDAVLKSANAKGQGLGSLLANGSVPALGDLFIRAVRTNAVAVDSVTLQSSQGDIVLEVTVIPMGGTTDGAGGHYLILARDLTMERNLRSALVESRQRYKDLVEVNSDFAWETDTDGVFTFVSPRGALGFKAEALVGRPARDVVVEPERFTVLPFTSKKPLDDVEMWLVRRDGETACVLATCVPLFDQAGEWQGVRGICRDVTEERDKEAALARARHREQLLNHIVRAIRDEVEPENMLSAAVSSTGRALGASGAQIYRLDADGTFREAATYGDIGGDSLTEHLSGLSPDSGAQEIRLGSWSVLFAPTQYRQTVNGVFALWRHERDPAWDNDHRLLLCDVSNQLGIANEQIANHERILALSRTDSLTGLLNRRAFFEEELPRRIERLARNGKTAALFYVDLDNFKLVNDIHGHQVGDDALLALRDLLMQYSRPGDVVARLGGDEFAMWLDGIGSDVTRQRAETLLAASKELRRFSGKDDQPLGFSVGVAVYDPATGESLDDLIARADHAMYTVKHGAKGGFAVAPRPGESDATGSDAETSDAKADGS